MSNFISFIFSVGLILKDPVYDELLILKNYSFRYKKIASIEFYNIFICYKKLILLILLHEMNTLKKISNFERIFKLLNSFLEPESILKSTTPTDNILKSTTKSDSILNLTDAYNIEIINILKDDYTKIHLFYDKLSNGEKKN